VLYEFCSCISMPVWLKARAEGTLLFVFGDDRQAMDRGKFSRADQRSKWPGKEVRTGAHGSVPDCALVYLTCAFVCLTSALTVHLSA